MEFTTDIAALKMEVMKEEIDSVREGIFAVVCAFFACGVFWI